MATPTLTIEQLWDTQGFVPNDAQREAILHVDGPLYLPAGPGSGKTRVLLWRTLNLIVFHGVEPDEIYLSTFTEKAARQLTEGLQAMLGDVTNRTGRPFDLAQMYVGTVHSLCQRLLGDRRFSPGRLRPRAPRLLDELGQYFFLYRNRNWRDLLAAVDLDIEQEGSLAVDAIFGGRYDNKHSAVQNVKALFNRFSEECIEPDEARERLRNADTDLLAYLDEQDLSADDLDLLLRMYAAYRTFLAERGQVPLTDFSLVQQEAFRAICECPEAGKVFRHVIVDEYQDTNTIQERLFFTLAEGTGNLCVVGDDDQALYRFRGATVENFVQFPQRCRQYLGREPIKIPLSINYRSRQPIVDFYGTFIDCCDWRRHDAAGHFRVTDKEIRAHRNASEPAVLATNKAHPDQCFAEIADLVIELLQSGCVEDPNQIAFLFPSLKTVHVGRAIAALEARGLQVYAPRANRFLEVEEATEVVGLFQLILGNGGLGAFVPGGGSTWNEYRTWLHNAKVRAQEFVDADDDLARYVADRQAEIDAAVASHAALLGVAAGHGWDLDAPFHLSMRRDLSAAPGVSEGARRGITGRRLQWIAEQRAEAESPVTLRYVIRRVTSMDWSLLDAFYHLCGMRHFRAKLELAESGVDEGPIYNLALLSHYLRRFADEYSALLTADLLSDDLISRLLFGSFLYALWRLGESEFEDEENPFPKGRIPFLTIHQSKGLEFPVVVLGNPYKADRGAQITERMVRPFLDREPGEPLHRLGEFDLMRMFYVALSRAENLLVIPHFSGSGQRVLPAFRQLFGDLPTIADLDLDEVPCAHDRETDLPKPYSYTSDYVAYLRCPRQYMIYRKYGFEPSRTQTAFYGSLVHRTLDDMHNLLISRRRGDA